jgi:hypothetical protein
VEAGLYFLNKTMLIVGSAFTIRTSQKRKKRKKQETTKKNTTTTFRPWSFYRISNATIDILAVAPMQCEERIAWYSNITLKELGTILTHPQNASSASASSTLTVSSSSSSDPSKSCTIGTVLSMWTSIPAKGYPC